MPSKLIQIYRDLSAKVDCLSFSSPITHVYNPLVYARAPFEEYLNKYGAGKKKVVLVGMNPGPFGMAQTGVPFGDVVMVSDWVGVQGTVGRPKIEHPKRPVDGFECKRREVSGTRLWTWAADRFGSPTKFFEQFFVLNYCPLVFMEASGKNRTPDKLNKKKRQVLFEHCDLALKKVVQFLDPEWALGVGAFAEKRLNIALVDMPVSVGRILHPSPASPLANQGWATKVDEELTSMGVLRE